MGGSADHVVILLLGGAVSKMPFVSDTVQFVPVAFHNSRLLLCYNTYFNSLAVLFRSGYVLVVLPGTYRFTLDCFFCPVGFDHRKPHRLLRFYGDSGSADVTQDT